MASHSFPIVYAVHTASCTFLLDEQGFCRRIIVVPSKRRDAGRSAAKCVGAQYVASIDATAPGCLVDMPRVGAAMLFASVDERGRVSLARTGEVTRFERRRREDPFADSVETSAPSLTVRAPDADPSDFDTDERTQRMQTAHGGAHEADEELDIVLDDDPDVEELATAQYLAHPGAEALPARTGSAAAAGSRQRERHDDVNAYDLVGRTHVAPRERSDGARRPDVNPRPAAWRRGR